MGEDSSTASLVSNAQIVRLLNEGQRKLCWEAPILMTCATASTVASQEQYSLPSDYLKMDTVFIYQTTGNNQKLRLTPITARQRDPVKNTGGSYYYYIWGINVSGVNSYYVGLNPIPDSNGSSDLEIYYHQLPLTMVDGGQGPEVPTQWQDALISYALWKIYRRAGRDFANMRDEAKAEWTDWLAKARRYVNPLQRDIPTTVDDTAGYYTGLYE